MSSGIVIGVLHGCRMNGIMFEQLFREYIKKTQSKMNVSFVFIDGMYDHSDHGKMWYENQLHLSDIGKLDLPMSDIEKTMCYIDEQIESNHIQVLMGFSQGGNVISTYLKLRQNSNINLAIIMAGYDFPMLSDVSVKIPILYIGSDQDQIVPMEYIVTGYSNIDVLKHDKGHVINCKRSFVSMVVNWMYKFIQE